MKLSTDLGLALIALLPLGCAGAMPAASGPSDLAPTQRPADVTVVDLRPADAPAIKAPEQPKETDAAALAKEAEGLGVLGVLNSGAGSDPDAPVRDDSLTHPTSPPANVWGALTDASFGAGGLGLSGEAAGGGIGTIGIGTIGLGHGAGTGTGTGFGTGRGQIQSASPANVPRIQLDKPTASAGLPPEIIQRIVRRNINRFRFCYERGLSANPKLAGKVVVRFAIDKTGAVSTLSLSKDTTLPDASVAACVVTSFAALSFPQPDAGGIVSVVYPLQFSPADPAAAPTPAAPARPPVAPVTPKSP